MSLVSRVSSLYRDRSDALALRLIAVTLTGLWSAGAVLVLTGYRPGGPADLLVGACALLPALVAAAGVVWPPTAQRGRATLAVAWLGIGSVLLLAPSIAGLAGSLSQGPAESLIPSAEAAYGFLLPLVGTAVFAGIGVATRLIERPRVGVVAGVNLGLALALASGALFAGATIANERALLSKLGPSSAWGPTDPSITPPRCNGTFVEPPSARVALDGTTRVDSTEVAHLSLAGARNGTDERWETSFGGRLGSGEFGYIRLADRAWLRNDGAQWVPEPRGVRLSTLDSAVAEAALTRQARATAEEVGLEDVGGARARHCRIAVDGPTALRAFPALRWIAHGDPFAPEEELVVWRGDLDWWVFSDAALGMTTVSLHGPAFGADWTVAGFQVTLEGRLAAVDRGKPAEIGPPEP